MSAPWFGYSKEDHEARRFYLERKSPKKEGFKGLCERLVEISNRESLLIGDRLAIREAAQILLDLREDIENFHPEEDDSPEGRKKRVIKGLVNTQAVSILGGFIHREDENLVEELRTLANLMEATR